MTRFDEIKQAIREGRRPNPPPATLTLNMIARDILRQRCSVPPERAAAEWVVDEATFDVLCAEMREFAKFHERPVLSFEHGRPNIAICGIPVVIA